MFQLKKIVQEVSYIKVGKFNRLSTNETNFYAIFLIFTKDSSNSFRIWKSLHVVLSPVFPNAFQVIKVQQRNSLKTAVVCCWMKNEIELLRSDYYAINSAEQDLACHRSEAMLAPVNTSTIPRPFLQLFLKKFSAPTIKGFYFLKGHCLLFPCKNC